MLIQLFARNKLCYWHLIISILSKASWSQQERQKGKERGGGKEREEREETRYPIWSPTCSYVECYIFSWIFDEAD